MKSILVLATMSGLALIPAQGAMMLDFNSTSQDGGPHPEAGYLSYDAGHEVAADFVTKSYNVTFANTGAATVTVTPDWPNTNDNRVQQMIDRTDQSTNPPTSWDATWQGNNLNLLTDWLGTDSRTNNGGNGDYDGTNGTPTYLTIALGGLPADTYSWTSFHHDTEKMTSDFVFEISTDGGANYTEVGQYRMTHSTSGGAPNTPVTTNATDGDPHNLSSTVTATFNADGTNDVVIRLTPLANTATGIHTTFVGINGFELEQVPEPSSLLMLLAGGLFLGVRRRR
jgi:hypothetical protein